MNILGVIPARFASSRFPGKPLANIYGKSMIQHVYERAIKADSLKWLIVATDDKKIYDHVKNFGGMVMMTSSDHTNGTSRVVEVVNTLENEHKDIKIDVIINIQGDEPFIKPEQIDLVSEMFMDEKTDIATLCKKIGNHDEIFDPNVVKVVKDNKDFALYFSRAAIPFNRENEKIKWVEKHNYYKHLGIYGYRNSVLKKIVVLKESELEKTENLEQLRWLENGLKIKLSETEFESLSVDTPDDLKKFF